LREIRRRIALVRLDGESEAVSIAKPFFDREINPGTRFLGGLALMLLFLFQSALSVRCAMAALFLLLALSQGKRVYPVLTLVVMAVIIAFNLIVPYGPVFATVLGAKLTTGALFGGIEKAVTLEGMLWLSRVAVGPDLRLPGAAGELLAESFAYFARISEEKGTFDRKDVFGSLDRLLVMLWESGPAAAGRNPVPPRTTLRGALALAAVTALCVAPYFLVLVAPLPDWLDWR
jgi:hypothetical protein